jgi:predicted MFS family arabinose efflux permease
MSKTSSAQPSLLPILLLSAAGFSILTTEFILVGVLPGVARDLHVTIPQAGLLVTLFAFTVALVGPMLVALLSRFPRKPLFVLTLLLFALSNSVAAIAPNIAIMAVARFIPALMLPVFWALASETAVDIVGPERAGKAISMVSFGIVAATIFGIPIGTLISDAYGWRTAFGALAVLAFAKAALLFFFLPRTSGSKDQPGALQQMTIFRDARSVGHVLLSLLVFAGLFSVYTYLADLLERLAGVPAATVGWILMGFGGMGLIGNWLGGKLVDRNPLRATIIFCVPLLVSLLALAPFATSWAVLGVALTVWGITQAALFTVSHVRVMKAVGEKATPALGASLNISGANLGIAAGAFIGGRTIDFFGLGSLGIAGAITVLVAIAAALVLMPRKAKATATLACADEC